ncbi:hypothetical protein V8G54_000182 (mitochondrion) [Vigna mungo]|uniref:Uncharacterized protein n=1 Tax=Vigna mungo TaxID=3915 RepID=A0AAQ3PDK4_VIGMU
MEGRWGFVPSHFRITRGFPSTNSMLWDSRESLFPSNIRNSAASLYRGLGWAVLIFRYCRNLDMMLLSPDSDSDSDASAVNIKTVRKMNVMFLQLNNSIIAAHYFAFTVSSSVRLGSILCVPSLLYITYQQDFVLNETVNSYIASENTRHHCLLFISG